MNIRFMNYYLEDNEENKSLFLSDRDINIDTNNTSNSFLNSDNNIQ